MTPEAKARELIDEKLQEAGWVVQDMKAVNPSAGRGIAIREYPTDTGPADYVLMVDRKLVGVIEAKRDSLGANLTVAEDQTVRYSRSQFKWRKDDEPLRFLFEATGQIIHFTDAEDPKPRARETFHFFRPETLAQWLERPNEIRRRLPEALPPLPTEHLRECQIEAVNGLERSLHAGKPRALIHMATGAGKTFTAITAVYRLLKFGGARRILFLVDTRNLGKQAHQEFMAYTPPDDPRKFTELYNVQRLSGAGIDPSADVCISTIQRMYSILSREPLAESADDLSPGVMSPSSQMQRTVRYNPDVSIETFDYIIIDECHRSIYNLWKQVLDYFDASLIGLTATPDKRTYGFFNENIVAEYPYERSVADGVNVAYDVYEIETEISARGGKVEAKEWVDHRERETRKRRWAEVEDDIDYERTDLDKKVVNPSQIRQVVQAMKVAVETVIYPERKETPKTLIFAKSDSHADDIIHAVREVYDQGNDFCKKVTYRSEEDPDSVLASFRNDYNPRIAVTVDMISTGTDVKALEILLFMREVRSKNYYEQMKGRGVRSLDAEGLRRVSASAPHAKDRFVLIDAVGVEKKLKTEIRSLDRVHSYSLPQLMDNVVMGNRSETIITSLADRLVRMDKRLDDKAKANIEKVSGGIPVRELGKALLMAVDQDAVVQTAIENALAKGIPKQEADLTPEELDAAREQRLRDICALFDNPGLRDAIENARRLREQIIDHINADQLIFSGYSENATTQAQKTVDTFVEYLKQHKDEIAALSFFYQQPFQRRALTFEMLKELHEHLQQPPMMLTTERLWTAYERVNANQVKGAGTKRQLTDLISLVRVALGLDKELIPFADEVDRRFQKWIFRHNAQRATSFTQEQTEWLRLMKDHIASSCSISRDDFEYGHLVKKGGLQRAWKVFGSEMDGLMNEMNEELVA
ncbi:MAG: type I restriction-modification enzyme R subunit C-terminal domain-containing protein [Lautropia sp.]|nr:type I restriction-modification enzyme R subunit C-terminal domain-containing protein [Lautropia sp.]